MTPNNAPANIRPIDLPVLPIRHTPEQLAAWRKAVAALPGPVTVPPAPEDPTEHPEAAEANRRAGLIDLQQRMNAEAERYRTDPVEIAKRNRLLDIQLATLDRTIGKLQARRAEVNARRILGTAD